MRRDSSNKTAPMSGNANRTTAAPISSGNASMDSAPPFLPLEESNTHFKKKKSDADPQEEEEEKMEENENMDDNKKGKTATMQSRILPKWSCKKALVVFMGLFFVTILYESFFVDPNERFIQPDFGDQFLLWVQSHPTLGLGAISLVLAAGVVTMVPIGTPVTVGCGYIYRGVYGWRLGLFVATVVSMLGSCLGACICFLLARYLMRETVQGWVRKYPLFDAIDVAAKEQGLKIMAMLYLTPVLPLGLVSYACGTTSMNLGAFAVAKVFSTPLYLIYTFIGASAHSFIKKGGNNNNVGATAADEAKQLEENQFMIMAGIVLSIVMMTLITRHIRKELMKILDQQKKDKSKSSADDYEAGNNSGDEAEGIEMGVTTRRRGHKAETPTGAES